MDFTSCGALEVKGAVQRAHVQWSDNGAKRNIRGPFRTDQEVAQKDLESMRAAASGMRREDGFSAMEAKAQQLREGKAPREQGSVEEFDGGYRADMRWYEGGSQRHAHGPRRRYRRPSVVGGTVALPFRV